MWAVYCATVWTLRVFRVFMHIEAAVLHAYTFMGFHWSIGGPLKTGCCFTGVLANSEGDQEFMENFKKLLETRQKEQLSPQKVQLYVCLRPFVLITCP